MPDIFLAKPKEKTDQPKAESLTNDTASDAFIDNDITAKPFVPSLDRQVHLFSSFCQNPKGLSFRNQEKDETILLFLRKAFITNFKWITFSLALLFLPVFIVPFVNLSKPIFSFPIMYIIYFAALYYVLVFSYIYVNFITWYFNIGLITNIRVLDIDFSGLIYKNIAATKISLVQDVSFEQTGVGRIFFDFGDLFVQTAGTLDNFDFNAVPHPENAVQIIEDLIGKNGGV
jgi:hypothetical protein